MDHCADCLITCMLSDIELMTQLYTLDDDSHTLTFTENLSSCHNQSLRSLFETTFWGSTVARHCSIVEAPF